MNDTTMHDFTVRVLDFFDTHDMKDCLEWNVKDGVPKFYIDCSDTFSWGCSDCEDLTPENFHILESALNDVLEAGGFKFYATYLFACRIRHAQPMKEWYKGTIGSSPKMMALFENCGPPIIRY